MPLGGGSVKAEPDLQDASLEADRRQAHWPTARLPERCAATVPPVVPLVYAAPSC